MLEQRFGVLLTVAYDGRRFGGFARQSNARTVAGELDGAVRALDPKASLVRGLSRTDAGVHARGQLVAFDSAQDIPARGWALGLSRHLSEEIAIVRARRVVAGFDPRGRATRKLYRYVLLESPVHDPFWRGRAWRLRERLNHDAMAQEAKILLGRHDFAAFRSAKDQRQDTVRTIFRASLTQHHDDSRLWSVDVEGDRFLYRMVRIIVGTLVDIGRGRQRRGAIAHALQSRDRTHLGMTAPPGGLYLEHAELNIEGTDDWPDH